MSCWVRSIEPESARSRLWPANAITPLGEQFAGGFLNFTLRNHPDGTQDFSGQDDAFSGKFPRIQFGTGQAFLSTDASGFPADTSFFAFGSPFVISLGGSVVLTGQAETIDAFFPGNGMMAPTAGTP